LLVHDLLLPDNAAWESSGQDHLRPSSQWVSAAAGAAIERQSGLAFIHSHPDTRHPPELSAVDRETSAVWARTLAPLTGNPFVSLVWSPRGVTGLAFEQDRAHPQLVDHVEAQGQGTLRRLHLPMTQSEDLALDDRQVRALSALGNATARELHVGIVGAGGTGSPVAEQLARIGVEHLTLVDPDVLDTESNVRRVVGSTVADVGAGLHKTTVVARHLAAIGLTSDLAVLPLDVRTQDVARQLLDLDLVITTTDTHSSRAFLNQLAYQYWLPVLDVGVRVGTTRSGAVSGMPVELRALLPDTGCLWCRRVLSADRIRTENLPPAERERLAEEGYVQGIEAPVPSLAPLNYYAAALAVLTALRLYSGQPVPGTAVISDAWEQYVQWSNPEIEPDCICHRWRGLADAVAMSYLPS